MRALRLLGVVVVLACLPARAEAAVTCTFGTLVGVAFGLYDPLSSTPRDSTGSISYTCTGVGQLSVTIDLSAGSRASFAPRAMLMGAVQLAYNLFFDAARTQVWGDGTNGTVRYGPLTPAGGTNTVNVYGRIPAQQLAPVGTYADTVVVTMNF